MMKREEVGTSMIISVKSANIRLTRTVGIGHLISIHIQPNAVSVAKSISFLRNQRIIPNTIQTWGLCVIVANWYIGHYQLTNLLNKDNGE